MDNITINSESSSFFDHLASYLPDDLCSIAESYSSLKERGDRAAAGSGEAIRLLAEIQKIDQCLANLVKHIDGLGTQAYFISEIQKPLIRNQHPDWQIRACLVLRGIEETFSLFKRERSPENANEISAFEKEISLIRKTEKEGRYLKFFEKVRQEHLDILPRLEEIQAWLKETGTLTNQKLIGFIREKMLPKEEWIPPEIFASPLWTRGDLNMLLYCAVRSENHPAIDRLISRADTKWDIIGTPEYNFFTNAIKASKENPHFHDMVSRFIDPHRFDLVFDDLKKAIHKALQTDNYHLYRAWLRQLPRHNTDQFNEVLSSLSLPQRKKLVEEIGYFPWNPIQKAKIDQLFVMQGDPAYFEQLFTHPVYTSQMNQIDWYEILIQAHEHSKEEVIAFILDDMSRLDQLIERMKGAVSHKPPHPSYEQDLSLYYDMQKAIAKFGTKEAFQQFTTKMGLKVHPEMVRVAMENQDSSIFLYLMANLRPPSMSGIKEHVAKLLAEAVTTGNIEQFSGVVGLGYQPPPDVVSRVIQMENPQFILLLLPHYENQPLIERLERIFLNAVIKIDISLLNRILSNKKLKQKIPPSAISQFKGYAQTDESLALILSRYCK